MLVFPPSKSINNIPQKAHRKNLQHEAQVLRVFNIPAGQTLTSQQAPLKPSVGNATPQKAKDY